MERRRVARLSSPTRVEAGRSQPDIVAEDVTTSSPPNAASVPPKEGAATPSPFPFRLRTPVAVYASSISTNMRTCGDLPGHQLISTRNLIASSPDDIYPNIADDVNFFMENFTASEWDSSGIRNLDAFLSFQAAAEYYLTCSNDSSEGIMIPLGSASWLSWRMGLSMTRPVTAKTARKTHRQTKR